MQYSDKVMEHFMNLRNMGEIDNASGVGEVGNPTCGDIMKILLDIDGDVIKDVKFKTFGSGSAIASSSMATEMIKGKTIKDALELTNKTVAAALDGLPQVKMHCSVLARQSVNAARK
ncbi:Fe-S cluster assembly scaffold protein NifU, partial [Clostridioides difficile]|uniref:Fe-S cluster assembly scaffold protein NifU n=1 Tax=Clostridioides difficile TaxID=1496 RepID=UPI000BC3DEF8